MAIYSCNLRSIGKSTHAEGTAGAHIRYIAREEAAPEILAHGMPHDPTAARTWLDQQERAARKNARMIDKIRLALPRELDAEQRAAVVRAFMADLTGGRVPWYAAIHQSGKDAHNPHAHIAVHDRDIETGKRVLCLSDSARDREKKGLPGPKAVEWIRERWEAVCNDALERAGHDVRIDRRTLEAQGLEREATIHVGPRAAHIDKAVQRPQSKARTNALGRVIDYPSIDQGRTRREFNAHVIDLNLEREARSGDPVRATWAEFERQQRAKDMALENRLAAERRQRTLETRALKRQFREQKRAVRAEWKAKDKEVCAHLRSQVEPERNALLARHRQERQSLRDRQSTLLSRLARRFFPTVRSRHLRDRMELSAAHKAERRGFAHDFRERRKAMRELVAHRYQPELARIQADRKVRLAALRTLHREADKQADQARQLREAEREQDRLVTESRIQAWRERQKQAPERNPFNDAASGRANDDREGARTSDNEKAMHPAIRAMLARRDREREQDRQRGGDGRERTRDRDPWRRG